jgi:histone-binding protein RBBP4
VVPGQDYSKQKLILGTHTSDNEQNYLMLAEVGVGCAECFRDQRAGTLGL